MRQVAPLDRLFSLWILGISIGRQNHLLATCLQMSAIFQPAKSLWPAYPRASHGWLEDELGTLMRTKVQPRAGANLRNRYLDSLGSWQAFMGGELSSLLRKA